MAVVLSARKEPVVGTPELLDWLGGMANMVRPLASPAIALSQANDPASSLESACFMSESIHH